MGAGRGYDTRGFVRGMPEVSGNAQHGPETALGHRPTRHTENALLRGGAQPARDGDDHRQLQPGAIAETDRWRAEPPDQSVQPPTATSGHLETTTRFRSINPRHRQTCHRSRVPGFHRTVIAREAWQSRRVTDITTSTRSPRRCTPRDDKLGTRELPPTPLLRGPSSKRPQSPTHHFNILLNRQNRRTTAECHPACIICGHNTEPRFIEKC